MFGYFAPVGGTSPNICNLFVTYCYLRFTKNGGFPSNIPYRRAGIRAPAFPSAQNVGYTTGQSHFLRGVEKFILQIVKYTLQEDPVGSITRPDLPRWTPEPDEHTSWEGRTSLPHYPGRVGIPDNETMGLTPPQNASFTFKKNRSRYVRKKAAGYPNPLSDPTPSFSPDRSGLPPMIVIFLPAGYGRAFILLPGTTANSASYRSSHGVFMENSKLFNT